MTCFLLYLLPKFNKFELLVSLLIFYSLFLRACVHQYLLKSSSQLLPVSTPIASSEFRHQHYRPELASIASLHPVPSILDTPAQLIYENNLSTSCSCLFPQLGYGPFEVRAVFFLSLYYQYTIEDFARSRCLIQLSRVNT